MSKVINKLVGAIVTELESPSIHSSLDHVEDEVQQLVDIIGEQGCTHCNLNTRVVNCKPQPTTDYIKG